MRVTVDGGELQVEVAGCGSEVLFVHGWPLDHRAFKPQFDALAHRYRVLSYDRRGFGQSTAPPNLRLEVDDILRILDACNVETVHLVGMSQGGRVAIRFATSHPDRLTSLSLQGTAADNLQVEDVPAEKIPLMDYVSWAKAGHLEKVIQHWLAHPMMSDEGRPEVAAALARILDDYQGTDLINYNVDSYAWKQETIEGLKTLPVPVLLLTGEHDSQARKDIASNILELVPDGREHRFEHAGHLSNLTAPEEFNAVLLSFFEELE